ncbi:MAG TPA: peptide chain release factor N(5)-glutamine methyltransferase, partial [Gammaproteobacteria bacterium]|nr:peptide chain release factor N(5)-glutamine methyltransferase [Gammaproteobacteria bacterium]
MVVLSSLDREILLSHVLKVTRSYLYAHPTPLLTKEEEKDFLTLLERAKKGEPIAYLIGHREFWSLDLIVTPDTLIPRPETELLVELILKNKRDEKKIIADLGTGNGAIALAIASERPDWMIYATDINKKALQVAEQNAARLQIKNIQFCAGSWCAALPPIQFDAIVSNPPYIAEDDPNVDPAVLNYEPRQALIAGKQGLEDLEKIILK